MPTEDHPLERATPLAQGAGKLPEPARVERSWLAAYPPAVPPTYDYPLVPLTRLLDDAARDFPQSTALEFFGATMTYRELLDQVDRFAAALAALGVGKGDRVAVILPNCPQHVVAIFATLRLGAVVAEADAQSTAEELELELNDVGPKAVVCLDPVYERLAQLKGRLPTVEHVIGTGVHDALPFPKNLLHPLRGRRAGTSVRIPESEGVLRFVDLIAGAAPTAVQEPVDAAEDVAILLSTSGTTGTSKRVMLTHLNLVANAFQARLWVPDVQAGRETVLAVMPFSHAFGLTTCLTFGVLSAATIALVPRFEPASLLKAIARLKPTVFPAVPTICSALNEAGGGGKHELSSIRACLSGAAPLPPEVGRRFEELTGGKVRETYGTTESSALALANPVYGRAKAGSVGLPITDTTIVLVDPQQPTRMVSAGAPGQLAIAGPQVMKGYWNRPRETAAVLRDGWLLTGDIAAVDDEGYATIVGRASGTGAARDVEGAAQP